MLEMLNNIFDFQEMLSRGVDVTIYFALGVFGLILLVIRLGVSLFLGDLDGDVDVDMDADAGVDHGSGFGLFSTLSVLAFLSSLGWMGVVCRVDLGLGHLPSALLSAIVGFLFMLFSASLLFFVRKLNATVTYKPADAVGRTATVYLSIPKLGDGAGQVTVSVSGRRMTMNAISTGGPIAAFTEVVVKEARDDETLVVEPKYPASQPAPAAPQ